MTNVNEIHEMTVNLCEVTTVRLYKNMHNFSNKTVNN